MVLERGVLTHRAIAREAEHDATVTLARTTLDQVLTGVAQVAEVLGDGRLRIDGDAAKLGELLGLLDAPDPSFPIVTPREPLQPA